MGAHSAWRYAGVSVTGPAHSEEGGACQDAHKIVEGLEDSIIAIVCDGAGSTRLGGTAARMTCEALPCLLRNRLVPSSVNVASVPRALVWARRELIGALGEVRALLLRHALEQNVDPDELLSTLVGVIAHPRFGGIFFHVGDGAGLSFDRDGTLVALSPPANGEYLNTTYFLIENDWRRHLRFRFFASGFKSIVLMTDGVTDLALTRKAARAVVPFEPFFGPVLRFLTSCEADAAEQGLHAILDGEAARAKVDDDKTFVWLEHRTADV
jgi:hypothetical protein